MMCAQEFDRAAARHVEENEALAALFTDAAAVVNDAALRNELHAAASGRSSGLLISALHERNRSLRALLIALHAHVENIDGEAARRLEDRVWAELVQSTQRRHLDMALG
jgi:hypothetical protein